MHFPLSLVVTLLLTPVFGSIYPRDAYERLYARDTYSAELEARQAYQNILARQAYAHPELQGHALGPRRRRARDPPIRARGTPRLVYPRKRLRTRGGPPTSTLASLPEGNREGAETPSHSDTSGNHPAAASRISSPFANARPGRVDTSEIQPHPDQSGGHAGPSSNAPEHKLSESSANAPAVDPHPQPEHQASGALRSSGSGSNGEHPRPPPILKTNSNGGGRSALGKVSFNEGGMRKSSSTPSFPRGGLLGAVTSRLLRASEELVGTVAKSASRKHSGGLHRSSSFGGSPRAESPRAGSPRAGGSRAAGEAGGSRSHAEHTGPGSPTTSRASRSSLHSAGSSPGATEAGSNRRGQMGYRPRQSRAADAPGREHPPPGHPPAASRVPTRPVPPPASRARSRKPAGSRGRPAVEGAGTDGSKLKKGKHPHLERPPKRFSSTKPWNAIGLGITAVGAGVAGGAGVWGALEASKGASAAVLSAQAGLKIANASMRSADAGMLSAQAGVKGANAASLSAQAGMKNADASQLNAEAGMKSANAATLNAQSSIKSGNGTQLIGAVQLATALHDNITTVGQTFSDVQAGHVAKGAPAARKRKRSYPPVVLYYDW